MIAPRRHHPGEDAAATAEAAVKIARRWAANSRWRVLVIMALKQYRHGRDVSGAELPGAIQAWLQSCHHWREPTGPGFAGEVITSPPITVQLGGGDCDDVSCAAAAMARTFGLPAAIGWTTRGHLGHVLAGVGRDWTDSDGPILWALDPDLESPTPINEIQGVTWIRL